MSTVEVKKSYKEDEAVYHYLEEHDIYAHSDIGVDVSAIVRYARENNIPLSTVPPEIVKEHTYLH